MPIRGILTLKSTSSNLRRFLSYARPHRSRLLLSTIIGVVKYNLPVAFPWILKDAVDSILGNKPSRTGLSFDQLMVVSAVLFIFYAAITWLRSYIADNLAQAMVFDIRKDLFRHLNRLPLDFFQRYQAGAITSRLITDVGAAQSFIGLAGTNVFMDATSFCSIMVVMFIMNWRLATIACCTLPVYVFLQRRFAHLMRLNAREARRRMEILEGGVYETVAGISDIKSFTSEDEEVKHFSVRYRSYLKAVRKNIRTHCLSLGATAVLTRIAPVMVIWIGGHLVLRAQLTIGALMAFYAYLEMIYNPLNRLSDLNLQLANARAAIDRLFEFFDLTPETARQNVGPLVVNRAEICFTDVVFGYRPGCPIFRGLSLRIPHGRNVALVGPSGAGKSTLIKLLVRFHDTWEGTITIDGQDICGVDLGTLRSQIALVQQDPVLFSGTVEDNIRLGDPEADFEQIVKSAALANALEFIEQLPEQFHTPIGERGVRFSGGQKQRIAIARAFLKNAPVLVLDESTSNLDAPSEKTIYEALQKLMENRTTIIIAHRLSTVARADSIVVLNRGEVVQTGTHTELLRDRKGLYCRLYSEASTANSALLADAAANLHADLRS
jgi:ABC-type multidrug transport system fused ATPase/permease subunit